jgi:hypothetical protein
MEMNIVRQAYRYAELNSTGDTQENERKKDLTKQNKSMARRH